MNQGVFKIFGAGLAILFGLFVVASALGDGGNSLSKVALYLVPVLIFGSFINGHLGISVIVLGFAYSDLLKRFLVIFGRFSFQDIANVLILVPFCTLAVFAHFVIKRYLTGLGKSKSNDRILLLGIATSCFIAFSLVIKFGFGLGVMKEIAQNAPYGLLIWVVQVAFPDKEAIKKFIRFVLIVFFPVALYGIKQHFMGFTDFELDYLLSGFSTEVKHLREVEIHAFSTMGSSVPFGNVMAILVAYAMLFYSLCKAGHSKSGSAFLLIVISLIFILACYSSSKRSTWIVAITVVTGMLAYRYRGLTVLLYGAGLTMFTLLVVFAGSILKNWQSISGALQETIGIQISTFSARMVGIYNWSRNPEMWTLFGVPAEERLDAKSIGIGSGLNLDGLSSLLAHDMIGSILLNYGAIALIASLFTGMIIFWKLHRAVLSAQTKEERAALAALLAVMIGCLISGFSNAIIFPVNAFGLLSFGLFLRYIALSSQERVKDTETEREKLTKDMDATPHLLEV